MTINLQEAATILGKTVRQVRYLIQTNRIRATKVAGRYVIERDDLPQTEPAEKARTRRQERLREVVEDTLEVSTERSRRYSIRDLKAFQVAKPLYLRAQEELGPEHCVASMLFKSIDQLVVGCHRYDRSEKAESYRLARDYASQALSHLALATDSASDPILDAIEQDLMPAFAGLLRRVDRKGRTA
ncbi:MAG: helix-turn-helix domain-containing protein [bacterium]|nr:helix-turn-helix domain-containing protein [bacterium]